MLVYNSTVHDSTGMSPFQAMFARCPRIPVDCTLRIPQMNNDVKSLSPKSYAQSKVKELQEMYTQCAQNMLKRHKRNKKMYDKKCRGPREFQSPEKCGRNGVDRVCVDVHIDWYNAYPRLNVERSCTRRVYYGLYDYYIY